MVEETYKLGLGTGIAPGQTVRGIFSAISWGAPIVETDTPDWSQIGVQAIKELSKINKVDITYHFSPGDPRNEFALPDMYLIKASEGRATPESRARNAQMQMDWAKDVNAKVIVVHPTSMIPRSYDRNVVFYNNIDDSVFSTQIPDYIWDNVEKGKIPASKARQEYLNEIRDDIAAKIPAQLGTLDNNKLIMQERVKTFENTSNIINGVLKEVESGRMRYGGPEFQKMLGDLSNQSPEELKNTAKTCEEQAKTFEAEIKSLDKQRGLIQREYARFLPPELRSKEYAWKEKISPEELKEQMILNENATTGKLADNFVRNFLPTAEQAIKSDIKVGIENMDSRFYFSHPDEINILMDKLRDALKNKGYSDEEIKNHIGVTFDYGHANTMADFKIKRKVNFFNPNTGKEEEREIEVPFGARDIKTPLDVAEKINAPIIHAHYSENYGDTDAHLVAGTSIKEGEDRAKKFNELQEFFKKKGIEPRIIHEGGAGWAPKEFLPTGYQISFQSTMPGYASVNDMSASAAAGFGPSYLAALPFDPIIEKGKEGESFFFPKWADELF